MVLSLEMCGYRGKWVGKIAAKYFLFLIFLTAVRTWPWELKFGVWGGGASGGKKKKTLSLSFHKKKRSRKAAPCRADCGGAHLSRLGFAVAYLHQLWFAWCLRSRPLHGRKMSLPFQINIFQPSTRTPPSSGWGGGERKKIKGLKKKIK